MLRIYMFMLFTIFAGSCLVLDATEARAATPTGWTEGLPPYALPARRPDGTFVPRAHPKAEAPHAKRVGASGKVQYYGGPVVTSLAVVQVNWNASVDMTIANALPAFYKAITNSAYFDWLVEYDTTGLNGQDGQPGSNQSIGRGSFVGTYTLTPSTQSTDLQDSQIASEVVAQIQSGALPQPTYDAQGYANTIYMIQFPPGVTINVGGATGASCSGFCAYHYTTQLAGKPVLYGVLPDLSPSGPCGGGCGNLSEIENVTRTQSHEMIEAVTDAEIGLQDPNATTIQRPIAWYCDQTSCGEVGDICNQQADTVAGFTVQKEWSNALGSCISTNPNVTPPLCSPTVMPPNCTPCKPSDCTGATPACATTGPQAGLCVACTTDANCTAPEVCDPATDTCVACTTDAQCKNPEPVCTSSKCAPCSPSAPCGAGLVCGTAAGIVGWCIACQTDADCHQPGAPHCDPTQHTCGPAPPGPPQPDAGTGGTPPTQDASVAPLEAGAGDGGSNAAPSGWSDLGSPSGCGGCATSSRGDAATSGLVFLGVLGAMRGRRRARRTRS